MTSGQPGPEDPEMIQRRIRHARGQLLGGRGPGASPMEIARWTRERPSLGGQPPAASREQAAEQAKLARGDPEDLAQLAARREARLAATLGAVRTRLAGRLTSARRHARVVIPVSLAGAVIALAWQAAGRRAPAPEPRSTSTRAPRRPPAR